MDPGHLFLTMLVLKFEHLVNLSVCLKTAGTEANGLESDQTSHSAALYLGL